MKCRFVFFFRVIVVSRIVFPKPASWLSTPRNIDLCSKHPKPLGTPPVLGMMGRCRKVRKNSFRLMTSAASSITRSPTTFMAKDVGGKNWLPPYSLPVCSFTGAYKIQPCHPSSTASETVRSLSPNPVFTTPSDAEAGANIAGGCRGPCKAQFRGGYRCGSLVMRASLLCCEEAMESSVVLDHTRTSIST